jgi:transcriptional regulator GlxA family with amidase domain
VQAAKRLIDQTTMGLSDIAFAAGFRSVRRFNDAFRATYGRPPSSFRKTSLTSTRIEVLAASPRVMTTVALF